MQRWSERKGKAKKNRLKEIDKDRRRKAQNDRQTEIHKEIETGKQRQTKVRRTKTKTHR